MKKVIMSLVVALVTGVLFVLPVHEAKAVFSIFSSHKTVGDVDGQIRISLSEVNDGKAHYYQYKSDGNTIKFFIVKSRDGVIRAAFDACDVCFPEKKGYSQDGDFMICKNCGRRFHSNRINVVEGGCNPAPLAREIVGQELVIKLDDVVPGGRFF
ncbi:MAG: Fe-S-containing protein [Desulforhopalus sp.]